jgi:hypothetical protein
MIRGLLGWFRSKMDERRDALTFQQQVIVRWDDAGISARYPKGEVEAIRWADVDRIAIETNDSGPWGADFWWLIEGSTHRCAYPQGATGEVEAIDVLKEWFPEFDWNELAKASCCTSNVRFVCWERTK